MKNKKILSLLLATVMILCLLPAGAVSAEKMYTAPTNLPAMYITLSDGVSQDSINKEEYLPGSYSLVGAGEYADIIDKPLSIKGRGNYSWSKEKKPYNIKLDKKADLLGMGAAKKWTLLANYLDKTLLRNYLTMRLGQRMGMSETTDCRFIDLYVNGSYYGNFLLTEKVEVGEQRVNVDADTGSVLFEIEQAYRHTDIGCSYCHETPLGTHITYKDPEYTDFDDINAFYALKNTTDPIIDAAESAMKNGFEAYSAKIDVDSFVNWYVINEYVKNYDSAFVTSCYCYYDSSDSKIHMGPLWDYDTCYGNQDQGSLADCLYPEGFHVSSAPWYKVLTADKDFARLVKKRWTQLRNEGVFNDFLFTTMSETRSLINSSQLLDQRRWPGAMALDELRNIHSYFTYSEEYNYMTDWMKKRVTWLDTQWNINSLADTIFCPANEYISTTSLTGPKGVNNHPISDLFDGNTRTKYCANTEADGSFTFGWSVTTPIQITAYSFTTANDIYNAERTPVSWKLYGSNVAGSWTLLDTKENQPVPEGTFITTQYMVDSPKYFVNYELRVSEFASSGGLFQLSEMVIANANYGVFEQIEEYAAELETKQITLFDGNYFLTAQKLTDSVTDNEKALLECNGKTAPLTAVKAAIDRYNELTAGIVAFDTDKDGSVTAADALIALQGAVYLISFDDVQLFCTGLKPGEKPTSYIALKILRKVIGVNNI